DPNIQTPRMVPNFRLCVETRAFVQPTQFKFLAAYGALQYGKSTERLMIAGACRGYLWRYDLPIRTRRLPFSSLDARLRTIRRVPGTRRPCADALAPGTGGPLWARGDRSAIRRLVLTDLGLRGPGLPPLT